MARKIIVLQRTRFSPQIEYRVAFWLDTPSGRESLLANASLNSQVKTVTGPELSALRAGTVREFVTTVPVVQGSGLAQIQSDLQAMHVALQAAWTADATFDRYNSSWDGTTWTMQNNP